MIGLRLCRWLSLLVFVQSLWWAGLALLGAGPTLLWAGEPPAPLHSMKTEDYISAAFEGKMPSPQILWVTNDTREQVKKILQRSNFPLRYRYYKQDNRTLWILDEIGKVMPITTGIIIENNQIIDLTVLTYRESHGAEIAYPAYRNQYHQAELTEDLQLSKPINGISGATLSTNAMKKVSRLALYLHKKVMALDKKVMENNVAPTP